MRHRITERIDNITKIGSQLGEHIPAPHSVKIELNSRCNYHCSFCVRSIRKNDSQDMDRNFYSRIIREMKSAGVKELGLFYINEPFTVNWLPEAIAEAKEVGFEYVFITTNGSVATLERIKECMHAGLNSIKFSINFSDKEQFEKVTKSPESLYQKALNNIKVAREIRDEGKYDCGIYASSIAFDGEQGIKMNKILDTYVQPYVDEFYFLPLYGMSGASKENGMRPKSGNPGRLDAMRDSLPCWSVFTEGHITVDGQLSACCFGAGLEGELNMADLNQVDFMTGWNSEKFQKLRKSHIKKDVTNTPCEQCIASTT